MSPREAARRGAFFVLALPLVLRAAWRVRRFEPRLPLPDLVDRLRRVRPLARPYLKRPTDLEGCVGRVSRLLPLSLGPCLKRSLILLDVWSRCGLEPRLHLGIAHASGTRCLHAWVTATGGPDRDRENRYREIWSG